MPDQKTSPVERRGIKSVETAGRLLDALCRLRNPAELRVLAAAADMSAGLAHAYLTSFGRLGLVKQDRVTKRYSLGQFALDLGLSELRTLDPIELALNAVSELRLVLDHTVALSVWGSGGPTVIRVLRGDAPLHSTLYEGATLPLATSATGRAFCAFLTQQVVSSALRTERKRGAARDDETFATAIKDARAHGLARIFDQPIPGLVSFSAPVFNHVSTMVCALTVTGRAGSVDSSWGGTVACALLDTTHRLSERLGMATHADALNAHLASARTAAQ